MASIDRDKEPGTGSPSDRTSEGETPHPTRQSMDIAIVGMACRFPGCSDWGGYWKNLRDGVNAIEEIPPDRWDTTRYYSPDVNEPNKSAGKWSGLVVDHNRFDNQFFHISPREAMNMEPQQRLLLEETWHCIEDSGIPLAHLQEVPTSVSVGVITNGYHGRISSREEAIDAYAALGHYGSIASNRISYTFNFSGASLSMDGACASSLYALHHAKLSLERGECRYALAAGVSITNYLWKFLAYSKQRILSPDGQCKTFDKDANGFVPGEGVGVVLLQPLEQAIADGNVIYGVLKGSAVNHVGTSHTISAPRVDAQRNVILAAYENAGIAPSELSYLEAHGTGTSLGDPIEIEALSQVFAPDTDERGFCGIGSAKTNVGHLEACAGLAGLIKILLMMRHRQMAPTLNLDTINPMIDFARSPFVPVTEPHAWQPRAADKPLLAGISAFGFGGSNAHAVLASFEDHRTPDRSPEPGEHLFLLSAKSKRALHATLARWRAFSASEAFEELDFSDICRTVARSRGDFPVRAGTLVANKNELRQWLQRPETEMHRPATAPLVAAFSECCLNGWTDLKTLYARESLFREALDALLTNLARPEHGLSWDWHDAIRVPVWPDADKASFRFCVAIARFDMLTQLGVTPSLVVAGSDQVYQACCAAGVLEPRQALALLRGERTADQVRLSRPSIPLYDPVHKRRFRRYHITAASLEHLRRDLVVTPREVRTFLDKASLLIKNQFSFLKFLRGWANLTERYQLDLFDLIRQPDLAEDTHHDGPRLLATIAISTSLHQVNLKWNLSDLVHVGDTRFTELVNLVAREVMPREELIAWLLHKPVDLEALAEAVNRRQDRLDPDFDYRWLGDRESRLDELPNLQEWKDALAGLALGEILTELCTEHRMLTIGASDADGNLPGVHFSALGDHSFLASLLELALQGAPIRWQHIYPDHSYRKVPLPIYAFDRHAFWPVDKGHHVDDAVLRERLERDLLPLLSQAGPDEAGSLDPEASFAAQGYDARALDHVAASIKRHFRLELGPPYPSESPRAFIDHLLDRCHDSLIALYPELAEPMAAEAHKTISPASVAEPRQNPVTQAAPPSASTTPNPVPRNETGESAETRYFQPVWVPLALREDVGSFRWIAIVGLARDHRLGQALIDSHADSEAIHLELDDRDPLDPLFWDRFVDGLPQGPGAVYFAPEATLAKWQGDWPTMAQRAQTLTGGLMLLCQSLGRVARAAKIAPPRLTLISAGAYSLTTSHPPHNPIGAALVGMCSSLPIEYQDWNLSAVDLDPNDEASWPDQAVHVAAETFSVESGPILLRGGMRFRRTFQQLALQVSQVHPVLRRNGRYLILGGSGGIGLRIGSELHRRYDAKVCLVGRRPSLDRPIPEGMHYRALDICDAEAMAALVTDLKQEWGGIDGIFHSADTPYSALHREADLERSLESLRPKMLGATILAQIARDESLDFLVFFSSIAGLFPVQGGGSYGAANAFIDALGLYLRRTMHTPTKVINWGLWKDTGLAVHFQDRHLKAGFLPFVDDEGETACATILAGFAEQVVPLKATPRHFAERGFENSAHATQLANPLPRLPRDWHHHIVHAMRDQFERQGEISGVFPELQNLCARLLLYRMETWGIAFQPGSQVQIDREISRLGIMERFHRLFRAMLGILERSGWLIADGLHLRVSDAISAVLAERDRVDREKQRFLEAFPVYEGFVSLVERSLSQMREVIRGQKPFAEVLFPNGKMDLVQPIYRDNPNADFFNRLVAQTLVSFSHLHERKLEKPVVLEVGAGTGGTSVYVFEALIKNQIEVAYHYTDISHAFINYGRQRFGSRYPNIAFEVLNLEQDLARQGFTPGQFDFIFGSNVVHATRNVRDTLARLKSLLRPGGLLVLNEITAVQDFATLTFGLTEGWWLYEDQGRRLPNSPLLDVPRWRALLESLGFHPVWLPIGEQGDDGWIQHVLVAASDGRIETKLFKAARDMEKPDASLLGRATTTPHAEVAPAISAPSAATGEDRNQRVQSALADYLRDIFGQALRFDFDKVGADEAFADYGVDSLIVIEVQERLTRDFGSIPNTLLFQYRTIAELGAYLAKECADRLPQVLATEIFQPTPIPNREVPTPAADTTAPVQGAPAILRDRRSGDAEPIAIVGVSGRYPKAEDLDQFWRNLVDGTSCIGEIPPDRWDYHPWFAPEETQSRGGRMYSKWGGFIDDAAAFDPLFFGISPKEAHTLDPQERLMLELAWSAIEDAGHTPTDLREAPGTGGNVGVFVGVTGSTYQWLGVESWARGGEMSQSFSWSVANRISFQLDFNGPSVPVDTACSSSLAAIHFAAASLRRGECRSALVGGVNLYLHPAKYAFLCHMTMLSRDDRCRAFGKGANGFVPGEGAGMLLLRPLSEAVADGDQIYAVLRGSAVNHGGRTNGFTVPNPGAQADLIDAALSDARLKAADIGYVEAHGTGTLLGDPVEVEGLTQAFERAGGSEHCALGSLKSNIGHLESAAGVAAVTKVLLQLRHRTLVPTLHADPPNSFIDFDRTPFELVQSCRPWEAREDGALRAGVSSFGAGGFNAHVILESHEDAPPVAPVDPTTPHRVLVLSARDAPRLRAHAQRILSYLEREGRPEAAWQRDLCFTLQTGRTAMTHRLALYAADLNGFKTGLAHFLEDREHKDLHVGHLANGNGARQMFGEDDEDQAYLGMLVQAGKWSKIARFWVDGIALDWSRFYPPGGARRISLPSYPFARERYWLRGTEDPGAPRLGPLLDRHLPTFDPRVVFARKMEPGDPLVRDNLVEDTCYLPFAAQLDMALAAAAEAEPETSWQVGAAACFTSAIPEKGCELELALSREGSDQLAFELRGEETYSSGTLERRRPTGGSEPVTPAVAMTEETALDVDACRTRLAQLGQSLSDYYTCFRRVHLGPRGLAFAFAFGEGGGRNATARLRLVHAALSICQLLPGGHAKLCFPTSLAGIDTFAPTGDTGSVHLRIVERRRDVLRVQIDICDGEDRPLSRYREVTLTGQADPAMPDFTYLPQWRALPPTPTAGDVPQRLGTYLVVEAGNRATACRDHLRERHRGARVITCTPGQATRLEAPDHWVFDSQAPDAFVTIFDDIDNLAGIYFLGLHDTSRYDVHDEAMADDAATLCLLLVRLIKAADRRGFLKSAIAFKVVTNGAESLAGEPVSPISAALHGLSKSIACEYPRLRLGVLDFDPTEPEWDAAAAMDMVVTDPGRQTGAERLVRHGIAFARAFVPLRLSMSGEVPFRPNGVYLIVGGARGIGYETAGFLARKYAARLVLVGRSAADGQIEARLRTLREWGGEAIYVSADIATRPGTEGVAEQVSLTFGKLHGVFHSAIVLRDQTLAKIDESDFRAALAPKVQGSLALAHALDRFDPDFLVFYSSAKTFVGDPGQGNYAAASAFEDSFAQYFEHRTGVPTFTVNWGYWGDVGIVADHQVKQVYARKGIGSIGSREGMTVVSRQLSGGVRRVMALKAGARMLQDLGVDPTQPTRATSGVTPLPVEPARRAMERFRADAPADHEESRAFELLDAWVRRSVLAAFHEADLLAPGTDPVDLDGLVLHGGVIPRYRRLLAAIMDMLTRGGEVEAIGSGWRLATAPAGTDAEALERQRQEGESRFPGFKPYFDLTAACLEALWPVLRGQRDAATVLFPNGSMEAVQGIYKGNRRIDYFNDLAAVGIRSAVIECLRQSDAGTKVRILEFGAGTGGTSAFLFRALEEFGPYLHYDYTDVSPAFLQHGRRHYPHAFVDFRTFDIEREAKAQGFELGSYDILVGANVIHAVADLETVTRNLKGLLKRGGCLLLNEVTSLIDFSTVTFGLTRGWWAFEDAWRIPHAPLLDPPRWLCFLSRCGFDAPFAIGEPGVPLARSRQAIVAGYSDGLVAAPDHAEVPTATGRPAVAGSAPTETKAPNPSARVPLVISRAATPEAKRVVDAEAGPTSRAARPFDLDARIREVTREAVAASVELPVDRIEDEAAFSEYGVDSVIGISMIDDLNRRLGLDLRNTLIFDYPDVASLCDHLIAEYRDTITPFLRAAREPGSAETTAAPRDMASVPLETPFDAEEPVTLERVLEGLATGALTPEMADALLSSCES
ncbi:SDR family NAD(P)-dependent oxidoreductase [Sulfidibacter corallicola]|uniref:SDR family NAD(P)-dependent oxidoreductase n=1 Tax=Sulfidibacter corallicola TaxID=2818388 RepID=A0A8A4TNK6_SULCO|nr:SDR family NAD(P)-dependent oxidoreductase [Sulfidibacter corallicola]QTD50518.1 SDR family NAD(P)-dependent oxidoreductase [Sulfidibacter corallicola]